MAYIEFGSIKAKNFMSVGNDGIEIKLNEGGIVGICGSNGAGKSTVMEVICFVLFNKPFRNISKPQLINSINQKDCVSEITFKIGTIQYKVIRGMKPNIFEIYQDGILLNKNADTRDYQKVLEQQILKLNYKTFTRVVILGAASFIPFMQLTSTQRREIVEDVLDIGVFSTMNQLNKEKSSITKEELSTIETKLVRLVTQIEAQTKLINSLSENHDSQITNLETKINEIRISVQATEKEIENSIAEIEELQQSILDLDKITDLYSTCKKHINQRESKISTIDSKKSFLVDHSQCPSCDQAIDESYKEKLASTLDEQFKIMQSENIKLNEKIQQLEARQAEIRSISRTIQDKNITISGYRSVIKTSESTAAQYVQEIAKLNRDTGNIDSEKDKRKEYLVSGNELNVSKKLLAEQRELETIAANLLKDTGIKTSIIREYLPIMNSTINKYLDKMDLYVNFELDESFNETIKSRHRDTFTYASFSEGEKQTIDIAILFAWRQLAKLKNSINTNILFLDEVLNGNLDSTKVDLLMHIFQDIKKDSNIFVITHKTENVIDKFEKILRFEKPGNFTTIIEE